MTDDRLATPEAEDANMGCGVGVPYVTSFCCCLSLEVGAKVIGFFHLSAALILMILCAIITSGIHDNMNTVEDAGDHVYSTAYPFALAFTVGSVAHILLALLLLLAAYKRWCVGLRSWVWIMLALWFGGLLYVVAATVVSGFSDSGSDIFFAFSLGVVFFVVVAYCIITVNSYYLKLKSTEDMEGPSKADY